MPLAHAKLSPSSAHRWTRCTASIKAESAYEDTGSTYAQLGTAMHEVGERCLLNKMDASEFIGEEVEGVVVDKENAEAVQQYVDYVNRIVAETGGELHVEVRLDLSSIAPDTFGTSDVVILDTKGKNIIIVDYKNGRNPVSAVNNEQMKLYALGAYNDFGFIHDFEHVEMHIVQPHVNNFSEDTIEIHDLITWSQWVKEQADKILNDEGVFNPSDKACKWCAHKGNCEALSEHVNKVITGEFANLDELDGNADKLDTDHLKRVLDNADLIEGFVKAVKEVALERLQSGEEIKGYKLVEGRTTRKWRDEAEVEEYLRKRMKVSDLYVKKMIPMTQILKLNKDDKKLQQMLIKPEGAPTLASESDRRPAITAVKDCFKDLG